MPRTRNRADQIEDLDLITHDELGAQPKTTLIVAGAFPLSIVSTTAGTQQIVISGNDLDDLQAQNGDVVEILSGPAAGDYTINVVINPTTFSVNEAIVSTVGTGSLNIYHPAASTRIGVDDTSLTNITGNTLQDILGSIDTQVGTAEDLATTLVAGNTTSGTNIEITHADIIIGETNGNAGDGGDINILGGGSTGGTGGSIILDTFNAGANLDSGGVTINTGNATGTGLPGQITLEPGLGSTGAEGGAVFIRGGRSDGANNPGKITIEGGPSNGAAKGGSVTIQGGTSSTGATGDSFIFTQAPTAAGQNSGDILLDTGNTNTASSGSITLETGNATGSTSGDITFRPGTGTTEGRIVADGQFRITDGVNPYDFPLGDGSVNEVLQTDGAGQLSFVDVNTLTTTEDLATTLVAGNTTGGSDIIMTDGDDLIGEANGGGGGAGGTINITSGTSSASSTGVVNISSPAPTTAGQVSGGINLTTGDVSTSGGSGNIFMRPGSGLGGTAFGGSVFIDGGITDGGSSGGGVRLRGGVGLATDGGDVQLIGGTSTQNTGGVFLSTPTAPTNFNSGDLQINTGAVSGTGSVGSLSITGGSATGGPTGGEILLHAGDSENQGGALRLEGGDGTGVGNPPGGNVVLTPGAGAGSGADGLAIVEGVLRITDGVNPYDFPAADGTVDQVLQTDGAGQLSFVSLFSTLLDVQTAESLTETVTTSTTFQTKLTLNATAAATGTYVLFWSYIWNHDNTGNDFEGQVLEDATQIMFHKAEPKDSAGGGPSGTTQRYPASGFILRSLTASTSYTYTVQFRTDSAGSESSLRDTRLMLIRIS